MGRREKGDHLMSSKLSSRARQHLKGLANPLRPVVQIGNAGLTDAVVEAVNGALVDHELIKVKIGKSGAEDRKQTGANLAQACNAELCQVIGRVLVLFRARDEDLPGRPRIRLPD